MSKAPGSNPTLVLLVEDDPLVAANSTRALEERGYTVAHASGAAAALEQLPDLQPRLALIDIDLGPGGDGGRLAREVIARHAIPVVFHTGHDDPTTIASIEDIAHFGYVTKNAGPDVLDQIVRMALRLSDEIAARRQSEARARDLMRESHVRTRTDMDLIRSMLAVQRFRSHETKTQQALYEAEQHLSLLQVIYDQIYREDTVHEVMLPELVEELIRRATPASRSHAGRGGTDRATAPEFIADVEAIAVERVASVPIGIIVLELTGNALRHAFPQPRAAHRTVGVSVRRTGDGIITIRVRDNGVGIDPGAVSREHGGFGLALVATLAEQFSGTLNVSDCTDGGADVSVTLRVQHGPGEA